MSRTSKIVVGLGFGDEGKGLVTDYLCSQVPPKETAIVVRFSGGQQAGHTVRNQIGEHVFSNFGSGTLRGIPSYFSEHCCVYLNNIEREKMVLISKGVAPKLYIHPMTKLTTPFDIFIGRRREFVVRHGSVGLGVGATMDREKHNYHLQGIDLLNMKVLKAKLDAIKRHHLGTTQIPSQLKDEVEEFLYRAEKTDITVTDSNILSNFRHVIFEGSQGIMLDMDHGIFPNVTYANTTSKNAIEICKNYIGVPREIYYVTRCYQTRHGNGWMSREAPIPLENNSEETNVKDEWQGEFRVGELDYELLNYAINVDGLYTKSPKNLVVTCLDQRPEFQLDYGKLNTKFNKIFVSGSPYTEKLTQIQ